MPPRIPRSGHLLDVGCAAGFFLAEAQAHYTVQGVELSSWSSAWARDHLKLPVITGTLLTPTFSLQDVGATVYTALGISPETELRDQLGRPLATAEPDQLVLAAVDDQCRQIEPGEPLGPGARGEDGEQLVADGLRVPSVCVRLLGDLAEAIGGLGLGGRDDRLLQLCRAGQPGDADDISVVRISDFQRGVGFDPFTREIDWIVLGHRRLLFNENGGANCSAVPGFSIVGSLFGSRIDRRLDDFVPPARGLSANGGQLGLGVDESVAVLNGELVILAHGDGIDGADLGAKPAEHAATRSQDEFAQLAVTLFGGNDVHLET